MPLRARLASTLAVFACGCSLLVSGPAFGQSAPTPHIVLVPNSEAGRAALTGARVETLATYGAFTLVEASGAVVSRLIAAGGTVRDDMREVRIGTVSADPRLARTTLGGALRNGAAQVTGSDGYGLAVVQYVGPLKDAWIAAVTASGVEVVSYMAQNGQLVSGDAGSLSRLAQLAGTQPFIRAVTPYGASDKLLPGLARGGSTEVVVSTVAGKAGDAARAALAAVATPAGDAVPVAGVVQHRVTLDAADLGGIAALGGVVAVEPFVDPKLLDERATLIIADRLDGSFQPVLGGGYRGYLLGKGFSTALGPVIDITDGGIDTGVVPVPSGSHPDFYRNGNTANPSRIVYAQNDTSDVDARDCGGHGTNVASIAAGFNSGTGASLEDAQGFNYGLGVAPWARLGATKIFNCFDNFDLATSISALHSGAFGSGARVSNNSWGANVGGAYNTLAREFDQLVRDAQATVAGNQQFVEVVSAGNSGSGGNTIGSPGTAKNVITVGASESGRQIGGSDGCAVPDTGSDSARDIIDFSSRGPTDDGRIKPDVVSPGTHVTGAQPQIGGSYTGSVTCNPQFPASSTLYSLVSGTSQAAPGVTGFAALIREWYLDALGGGTRYPSPAMTKALMINTATDLAGGNNGAGGTLGGVPTQEQGWGRINLDNLLDGNRRRVIDQGDVFTNTGEARNRFYQVWQPGRALRVTLVWTDPPGPTTGNSFVNDLDLEVTAGGITYKGNVFSGGVSVTGGTFDTRNNVENVFLPAGVTGPVKVRIVATNIAGDGVPGVGDATDQDYALVVSNVIAAPAGGVAILTDAGIAGFAIDGDGDAFLEPGEFFTFRQRLKNVGNTASAPATAVLTAAPTEGTVNQPNGNWPAINPNVTTSSSPLFRARVRPAMVCGDTMDLTIAVTHGAVTTNIPVSFSTGRVQATAVNFASTDVPKAIPDNNSAGVTSTLNIATAGIVGDVDVRIGSIVHTYASDLIIDLTSPAGTTVRLFNRHGGSGDNLINTVFDDAAATAIAAGAAPFTGSFRPFESLSAFNGQQSQGIWTLTVRDMVNLDIGTLNSWSVDRRRMICD